MSISDVIGMGMSAQTVRLNAIASNMANADTVASTPEESYRAKYPVFSTINANDNVWSDHDKALKGVKVDRIVESDAPLPMRYEPAHPKANKDGYIYQSNVNMVSAMADMITASRSYQTMVQLFNTHKDLDQQKLNLGR